MLRSSLSRTATLALTRSSFRPALVLPTRYSSTVALQLDKEVHHRGLLKRTRQRQDDLARDWDARILTYEQVKPKTQSPSPNAYLVDVREPDEVIQGCIPSSVNLPLSALGNSLHLPLSRFREIHGFEKPRKDQELVFYCRSGVRSSSASDVAKRNGYTNVFNYKGSWLDWIQYEGGKDILPSN